MQDNTRRGPKTERRVRIEVCGAIGPCKGYKRVGRGHGMVENMNHRSRVLRRCCTGWESVTPYIKTYVPWQGLGRWEEKYITKQNEKLKVVLSWEFVPKKCAEQ